MQQWKVSFACFRLFFGFGSLGTFHCWSNIRMIKAKLYVLKVMLSLSRV